MGEVEKPTLFTRWLRLICFFNEGVYCWWCVRCCPYLDPPPQKPDIQYILQHSDLNDENACSSSTCLVREPSDADTSTPSSYSAKDLKTDIYQQIELRRSNSIGSKTLPVIDIRPIEFWSGVKGEGVQPKLPGPPNSVGPPNPFLRSPKWFQNKMAEYEDLRKQIRPNLYQSTCSSSSLEEEEDLGRLHFAFHFDIAESALVVRVIEAMDLPPPANKDRLDQASSNPYVRVSLLPDTSSAKETCVKKKTQSPIFEETFAFQQISYPEITRRTLELKVKDFDKFSRHCVIGRVQIPLSSANLGKSYRGWKNLIPCTSSPKELGQLLLSLNFLPTAGRLNVDVIKAKQLLRTSILRGADPYVRVSVVLRERHHKSKKTSMKRNTLEPVFHESFSFRLSSSELRESSVVATVWDFNAGVVKDEFIGRVVLGKNSSGSVESGHWSSMLASERHSVAQWHSLHSRADCDQVSSASRSVP